MSTALISFLYKAADSRSDTLNFAGGGALAGGALGGAMAGEGLAAKATGAGLGALAGGSLGGVYGMNRDSLNELASSVFNNGSNGNPITTGIGAGVLGAGGLFAKRKLMQDDLPDTFKEHAAGGPAQHHEMLAALGADVPAENKAKFLKALADKEDLLTSSIMSGAEKTNPIHGNAIRALSISDKSKDWAKTLARRLAVKKIMGDSAFLEEQKNIIGKGDAAAVARATSDKANVQGRLNKAKGLQVNLDSVAPGKGAKPADPATRYPGMPNKIHSNLDLKQYAGRNSGLIERLMEKMKGIEAPKTGIPDSAGLLKHMSGLKGKVNPAARYGIAGLGAGALGMMLAGAENSIRS